MHHEVAAAAAAQVGDAEAAQAITWPDCVPGLTSTCSTPSSVSSVSVVPSAAAVIGTLERAVQVVTATGEDGVRTLDDLDVEVAGRAAAGADLALGGELDARAGVHARPGSSW